MRIHLYLTSPVLLAFTACGGAGRPDPAAMAELPGGAVTLWTDSTELFMEHPALVVGLPDRFAIHLTDLTDFAPLRTGRIELRFEPRDGGAPVVATQDAPRSPGIFGASPEFTRAGVYDLVLTVESPQARDVIRVPGLTVHATAGEVPPEAGGGESGISFLKEQQWKTAGFATAFAKTGSAIETFQAGGRIVPAAGRIARVAAPTAGVVEVSGIAASPSPGERVRAGRQLAVLTPALGEGGNAFARARAELREAEEEYARAKRLHEVEAVPARRLHEAEIRLTAAREALAAFGDGASGQDGKVLLRAPISGIVASRTIAPGSRVEAGVELFTIVDPSIVWLQIDIPAAMASRIGGSIGASFQVPGSEQVLTVRRVVSVGGLIDSISRTIPVIAEVANIDGALRIGMTARVAVETGQPVQGVLIPAGAVLDEDGRSIAYVQAEGERFEKRELDVAAKAGHYVLVRSGISPGERVVSGAAYQVRLASLSTSVPAHGHEH